MICDTDLISKATEIAKPRILSNTVEAGGVGSALVTDKGNIYVGVCIDISCSMGFCAERNAIGNMVTNGESKIVSIVAVNWEGIIYPPCGVCREFIYQMDKDNKDTRVILDGGKIMKIKELLPDNWLELSEMSGKKLI